MSPRPTARGREGIVWFRGRDGLLRPWLPEPCLLSCGQHSAREGSLLSIKSSESLKGRNRAHSCSRLMARLFGNGLIHLPGKWEDRNNYLPSRAVPTALCGLRFILPECAPERSYESSVGLLIKVMLLTTQIGAAGRALHVDWTLPEQCQVQSCSTLLDAGWSLTNHFHSLTNEHTHMAEITSTAFIPQ